MKIVKKIEALKKQKKELEARRQKGARSPYLDLTLMPLESLVGQKSYTRKCLIKSCMVAGVRENQPV